MTADMRGGASRRWDSFRVGDHPSRISPTRDEAMAKESGSALPRLGCHATESETPTEDVSMLGES